MNYNGIFQKLENCNGMNPKNSFYFYCCNAKRKEGESDRLMPLPVAPELWMDGQDERIICPRDVAVLNCEKCKCVSTFNETPFSGRLNNAFISAVYSKLFADSAFYV